jgi:CheY-like chemotaxis protein
MVEGTTPVPELRRILYAEDDPDIQRIARFALERVGGLDLEICSSGADALQRAEAFAPDLVLLDLMLPGMDGQELLGRLRALPTLAQTPVVFVTAKAQGQEIQDCLDLGALDVVTKPFDPMTLADRLMALWNRYATPAGAALGPSPARPVST